MEMRTIRGMLDELMVVASMAKGCMYRGDGEDDGRRRRFRLGRVERAWKLVNLSDKVGQESAFNSCASASEPLPSSRTIQMRLSVLYQFRVTFVHSVSFLPDTFYEID